MQYLAIVLMPTQQGLGTFQLSELLKQSFDSLKAMRNADKHACYQMNFSKTLKDGHDFLQTLNVERDSTVYEQASLDSVAIQYVVLAVTDDINLKLPLEDFTRNILLYFPDNHIHQELNAETEQNEMAIKSLKQRQLAMQKDQLVNVTEVEELEAELWAALQQQEALNQRWKEYGECPMQSFKGPQFDAGHAKTPVLPRMSENYSPVLRRTDSGVDLRAFYESDEAVAVNPLFGGIFRRDGRERVDNDNNQPIVSPRAK